MFSQARFKLSTTLRIPTLPSHVERLTRMIDAPDAGSAEVGMAIKEDPPLAGRVLRIANSSFYGLSEHCTSVEQASTILGLRLLRNVVVEATLLRHYEHLRAVGFDLERLWQRAVMVGRVGAALSRGSASGVLPSADEAYLSGLLADIGQVVLLDSLGVEYEEIHARALEHTLPLFLVERRDLGTTHADIGALVARTWGLPESVRCGIELHHGRRSSDLAIPSVYLAQRAAQIADRVLAGSPIEAAIPLSAEMEERFGIAEAAVARAIEEAQAALRNLGSKAA